MHCVFYRDSDGKRVLLDFFKKESSALNYMATFRGTFVADSIFMESLSMDVIKDYINNAFKKEVKQ